MITAVLFSVSGFCLKNVFECCAFMCLTSFPKEKLFFRGVLPFLETDKTFILLGDFNRVCEANDRAGQKVYIERRKRPWETCRIHVFKVRRFQG